MSSDHSRRHVACQRKKPSEIYPERVGVPDTTNVFLPTGYECETKFNPRLNDFFRNRNLPVPVTSRTLPE